MLEQIFDCQNYLEARNIDFTFSTWQNLYNDSKHISLTDQTTISDKQFLDNPLYKKINSKIKKEKFVQDLHTGLWEHLLSNKQLVNVQSINELHPNSLCHFDYFKTYFKPILDKKLKGIIKIKDRVEPIPHNISLWQFSWGFSHYSTAQTKVLATRS